MCTFIENCLSKMNYGCEYLSTAYEVLLAASPRKGLDVFFCFLQFLLGSIVNCHSPLTSGIWLFYCEKSLCACIRAGVAQVISVKDGGVSRMQWRDAYYRTVATAGLLLFLNQSCIRDRCCLSVCICQVLHLCGTECILQ